MGPSRNVIPDRIADALRRFPPFSMFTAAEVAALAAEAEVWVVPSGDTVWKQGERPGADVLFLAQGRVEYIWTNEGRSERVDVRDVGDVLGLTAMMKSEPYRVTAQAVEDSLFYGLPWPRFKVLLDQNDAARNYARRHMFWAVRVGSQIEYSEPTESSVAGRAKNILQAHLDGAQMVQPRPLDRLLVCQPTATIQEAAAMMAAKRVPSILVVDEERRPLGIVTSNSLVKHVIVEGLDKQTAVTRVMAKPVYTVSPNSSATAAILTMLRERIGQVVVTEDGTPKTKALDVCTHKDLLAQSGHHPAGLLREIRFAKSPARFRELCDELETIAQSYLDAGVSAIYLGQICAELYDELVQRLLTLSIDELEDQGVKLPKTAWAWMSVGSDGRREQILRTDMDNAMVFASTGSAESDERAREIFVKLATLVIDKLVAAGFARCQGGVMALNPRWCRTELEWIEEIESVNAFTDGNGLLRATVLFDLRFVAGERALCDRLREKIYSSVGANLPLQHRLAELIVDSTPPLNFIGRLVVEAFGGGDEQFDLKSRGMAPLRDAARLFALHYRLNRRHSTGGRWDELRRSVPERAEVAGLAREAYDFLLRLRTLNGLRRGDSGRHLDPESLTKLERAQLANVFDIVRTVQQAVKLEFQTEAKRL
jgi:Predicted signal-transduction protein containing cAMP-binding and CBS domains